MNNTNQPSELQQLISLVSGLSTKLDTVTDRLAAVEQASANGSASTSSLTNSSASHQPTPNQPPKPATPYLEAASSKAPPLPNPIRHESWSIAPSKKSKKALKTKVTVLPSASFPKAQTTDYEGPHHYGIKYVTHKRLLRNVSDADISEEGIATMVNAMLRHWAPSLHATCPADTGVTLGSVSAGKDTKFSGYISMMLPQAPEEDEATNQTLHTGLQELEDLWQSICKKQRHRDVDEESPVPTMASCFSFTIPPVNAQTNTLVGAIHGFTGSWTPPIDILGKRLIVTELIRVVLQTHTCPILEALFASPDLLRNCLGLYHYTPKQKQVDSKHPQPKKHPNHRGRKDRKSKPTRSKADLSQQVLVLAAANHVKGQGAAQALFAATRVPGTNKPNTFSVFGGIHLQLHSIPSQDDDIQKLMSSIVTSHMKVQPATYVTRVSAVNPGFQYHTEWALEASNNINHCIGVIPMATEGSGRLGAALILHKTHNVELRINDDSYFENLLMQYEDSPFPLTENKKDPAKEVIDVCSDDDGDPEDAMAQFFDPRHTTPSKRWAVIWSRGGSAGVGVYDHYAGEGGAKPITNGIPYNCVESHATTDYCWQRINYHYQGVDCEDRLRLFHMTCPESMTNLDVHQGPISCSFPPRPKVEDKVGYRFVIPDDPLVAKIRKLITRDHAYFNLNAKERAAIVSSVDPDIFQATDDDMLDLFQQKSKNGSQDVIMDLFQPKSRNDSKDADHSSPSKQATIPQCHPFHIAKTAGEPKEDEDNSHVSSSVKDEEDDDAKTTGRFNSDDDGSTAQSQVLLSQQTTMTEVFGQPFLTEAMVEQTQTLPPSPQNKKREAEEEEQEEVHNIATPSKRGRTEAPSPVQEVVFMTNAMTSGAPSFDLGIPPPPPGLEVSTGLAREIKDAHETLYKIWKPRPNSPTAGLESKMVTGYSIAIDVAPFTTYRDIQKIVGDLLPANGEGLVNVLLGRNNSAGNDFPNTAVLQSKMANIEQWIDTFKGKTIFQIPCRPRGWYFDEPEGYLSCPSQPGLEELAKDSLILWIKSDCPLNNHDGVAHLLRNNFDPQTIMGAYMALKNNGTAPPSI